MFVDDDNNEEKLETKWVLILDNNTVYGFWYFCVGRIFSFFRKKDLPYIVILSKSLS